MPGKNKHFTYEDRIVIQQSIREKLSLREIGKKLEKNSTSVSREIRRHLVTTYTGSWGKVFNDCNKRNRCPATKLCSSSSCSRNNCCECQGHCCPGSCPYYEKEECPTLNKAPYVCTGCSRKSRCKLPKVEYYAKEADIAYRTQLKELRSGVTISIEEAQRLAELISDGTRKGHSVHHIIVANGGEESIGYSEKTIYSYINNGVLPRVINLDLPRKVKYKKRKRNENQYVKVDKACRVGRTYADFLAFIKEEENRYLPIAEMDSVEGKKGVGDKVCLTLFFDSCSMMFGYIRDQNSASSVTKVFNDLKSALGEDVFAKLFPIILTDRGTEFSDPVSIEMSLDGKRRLSHVFYCDPMESNQKAEIERCHSDFRRIVPKGTSMNGFSQDDIKKAFANVAAIPRPQFNDRTSAEMFITIYGEDVFEKLGGIFVSPKDANLTPRLLAK